MDLERFGEIVSASVVSNTPVTAEQVASTLSNDELLQAVYERGLSVGSLAVESATDTHETPASVNILSELTPEQQKRATGLQTAMAEKFSTSEIPLTPKDFGLVVVGEGQTRRTVVMLTTGNGLYKGSYDSIMSEKKANKAAYMVEVDGKQIDTRKAMTWDLYQAFIYQAKADGTNPLPDSSALKDENNEPWTATWLTGEQPDGLRAQCGGVYVGGPDRFWYNQYRGWSGMRFRPAAVV